MDRARPGAQVGTSRYFDAQTADQPFLDLAWRGDGRNGQSSRLPAIRPTLSLVGSPAAE